MEGREWMEGRGRGEENVGERWKKGLKGRREEEGERDGEVKGMNERRPESRQIFSSTNQKLFH